MYSNQLVKIKLRNKYNIYKNELKIHIKIHKYIFLNTC